MSDIVIDPAKAPNAVALRPLVTNFEMHLANAYAAFGDLAAALPRARQELGLSVVVGHAVIAHFTDAGAAVAAALGHSVSGHRTIDKVADAIGVPMGAGDEQDKPSNLDLYPSFTTAVVPSRTGQVHA